MLARLNRRLEAVLSADVGLTILLVSLALMIFVIYPFTDLSDFGELMVALATTAVLISGSFSMSQKRLRAVAFALLVVALVTVWLRYALPQAPFALYAISLGSKIAFLALICFGTLVRVMRPGRVSRHHVLGGIAVYLMLGLIWGFAYSIVELRRPGSFHLPETGFLSEFDRSGTTTRELVYFSFVTLTTLGYGDVSPRSPGARTLATLEALVGQIYLVTLIAGLVSKQATVELGDRDGPRSGSRDH